VVLGINNTPSVMPEDLENLMQQGYQLIDVRENDEWDAGHYKNATHIPMGSIVESIDKLMVDKKYIFVCRSGARSGRVTNYVNSVDIESYNLSGGMKELQKFTKEIVDLEGNPGQII
jgi:rhodanese-related sulfurtransferase|tara:strand:+ start:197 stop:547 length:351 start_codon:yes stop_codon:yes gene_type:complete